MDKAAVAHGGGCSFLAPSSEVAPAEALARRLHALRQRFQAISAGPHRDVNDAISLVVLCEDRS